MSPRPSVHKSYTKSYAIDQIEDIEHLRRVAHRMWEAFQAAHWQAAHAIDALVYGGCRICRRLIETGEGEACAQWVERQRKVSDGFGSV